MPMMLKSLILLLLGGSLFVLAVRRLRTYKLRERYALVFLLLGLPFAVLAAWPNAIGSLADLLPTLAAGMARAFDRSMFLMRACGS